MLARAARGSLLVLSISALFALTAAPSWAAWSPGTALTGQLGPNSNVWPSIGVAPNGTAIAAWQDETEDRIFAAPRPNGGSFAGGASLGSGSGDADYAKTAAAVNDSGAAVVAWIGKEPGGDTIEAAYRPAGGSFSSPPAVLDTIDFAAERPEVAISAAGKAVVVWAGGPFGSRLAKAATHGSSVGAFTATEVLNDAGDLGTGGNFEPGLAIDGSGNAIVVFPTLRAGGMGTVEPLQWAQLLSGASQFGDAEDVGVEGVEADVAVDGSGRATAVWQKDGVVKAAVQATAGGSFGSALAVSEAPDGLASEPRLGLSSAGAATVVFEAGSPGGQKVMWSGGIGAFADPQQLSSAGNSGDASVAVDGAGNAAAVWTRFDGTRETVEGSYRPAGGSFVAPTTLSKANTPGNTPGVAIDAAGNATAIWQTTASFGVIWTSAYAAGSTPPPGDPGGGNGGGGGGEGGGGEQAGGGQGGSGSSGSGSGFGGAGATASPVTPIAKKPAAQPPKCPKGKKRKTVKGKPKCVRAGKPGKKRR